MNDPLQCSAFVRSRVSRVESRPCKYPVLADGLCRYHTANAPKPRPVRCEAEVLTYSSRGTHQCRLRATQEFDGDQFCTQHAKAMARTLVRAGRELARAS